MVNGESMVRSVASPARHALLLGKGPIMILHSSIAADHPHHVAGTVARLLLGDAFPLPGLTGDGWFAIGGADGRQLVEVLPRGTQFAYAPGDHVQVAAGTIVRNSPFHVMLATELDEAAVFALAEERRCQGHRARHGWFDVLEFWIEGCTLVEVMPPPFARAYRTIADLDNVRATTRAAAAESVGK